MGHGIINLSTISHATLGSLGADDHTQYLLANGTRALSDTWAAGSFSITADELIGSSTITASGILVLSSQDTTSADTAVGDTISASGIGLYFFNTNWNNHTMTTITGGDTGQVLGLFGRMTSGQTVTLVHDTAGASNKLELPSEANVALGLREGCLLRFDGTVWSMIGRSQG